MQRGASDQPPIRSCIHRRNSSRSINCTVPASTSARRRRISLSQASNASASSGASKLLTKACANSARSAQNEAYSMSQFPHCSQNKYRLMIFSVRNLIKLMTMNRSDLSNHELDYDHQIPCSNRYCRADPGRSRGAIAVCITIGLSIASIPGGCHDR